MCMSSQNRTLQHVQDSAESDSAVLCRTESQSTHRRVRLFGALQNRKSINSPQRQTPRCSMQSLESINSPQRQTPRCSMQSLESINSPQRQTLRCSAEPRFNQLTAEADSAELYTTWSQVTHRKVRLRGALHNLESINSPQSQTLRCSAHHGVD